METVKKKRNMCVVLLLKQEKKHYTECYMSKHSFAACLCRKTTLFTCHSSMCAVLFVAAATPWSHLTRTFYNQHLPSISSSRSNKKRRKESVQNGQNKRPSWTLMASVRRDDCVWPREESTFIIIIFDTKC